MKYFRFILLVCVAVLFMSSSSDRVKFSFLTIKDGLSQSSIKCIYQDSDGYLWIGTSDGLNKFDGYKFTIYDNNPINPNSICGNDITCIYENPHDSILWIGTQSNGLVAYNKGKDNFISFQHSSQSKKSIPSNFIKDILATKDQKLWFATKGGGICYLNPEDSTFVQPGFNSASKFHNVNCLETDEKGNLWLGTSNGLFFWSFEKQKSDDLPTKIEIDPGRNIAVTALKYDFRGNLFIGTANSGLFKYHPVTKQIINYVASGLKNSISSNRIRDILQTRNGNIWIATMDGLCKFNVKKSFFEIYRNIQYEPESLNNDVIYSLYEDVSGIIWIGTYLGGINKIDPIQNRFPKYNNFSLLIDNHKAYNDIRGICIDDKMSTWISTSRGLLELKPTFFTSSSRKEQIATYFEGQTSGRLLFHEDEGIFTNTNSGISLINKNGSIKHLSHQILQQTGHNIFSFSVAIVDSDGNIWFATGLGLLKYIVKDKSFKLVTHGIPATGEILSNILAIEEDFTGTLWLGTYDGKLLKFDRYSETFEQVLPFVVNNEMISFKKIFSIYESSPGIIWFGTNMGLYRYNDKTSEIIRFLESDGLSNNVVYGLLGDDNDNVWCSTNNGLSVFNIILKTFTNYTYEDGLQSNEFNQSAYFKSQDGTMYMGGIEGLNIFHPDNIKSNTFLPPIVISGMEIQHKPVDQHSHPEIIDKQLSEIEELKLSHKQATFSFEFTALSFSLPARNRYMYFLEGYDEDWVEAGNRRIATYTNVLQGSYIFKVKGSNNDGLWNETPATIKVKISPPFWKTIWFRLLLSVTIGAIIFLLFYLRLRDIKNQRALLRRKVDEKTNALSKQNIKIEKQNDELLRINREILNQNEKIKKKNHKLSEQHKQISKQRDNLLYLAEQVKEANQAKIRFFTSVSHEIRTPLTLIISPLKELVGDIENIEKNQLKRKFRTIYGNASKLLVMVNQLLDFRKMETDNMELNMTKVELVSFVQQIAFLFNEMAVLKHFDFSFTSGEKRVEAWVDGEKVEKIIYNLLSNAFKYTNEGGKISISVNSEKPDNSSGYALIKVKDSGIGIDKDKIPFIFERFYQLDHSKAQENPGSGLGLALTKKYIELHRGEILVESQPGVGSSFIVKIPLGNQNDESSDKVETDNKLQTLDKDMLMASISDYVPVSLNMVETSEDRQKPLLLIIEDDNNLREYLVDVLSGIFRVVGSESGEEGFEISKSKNPDIIICDVMLPGMNGFEFCQKVKSELRISHIPVILLTALADHDSHMSGIKAGADDFITKPFDLQHLVLKIENLIEQRRKLQLKYKQETNIDTPELFDGTEDKKFLKSMINCVENNLSDPLFNVDKLCAEVGLSQPQVYRKVKALTNLSISEFIRNIRLKKATQLLMSHKFKINEVAYEVGFSDPNYFTKCFIKLFRMTPSDYVKSF